MVKIKQRIVSQAIQNRVTYGGVNGRRTLTVHQTGNTRVGANAEMHARLQENGNSRAASWMIQSDDTEIIQSFPLTAQTWHAGDGRGNGNLHSISWEICINSDGNYVKSLEVAAKGIAQVLKDNNLTVADLRQHWDWSRKNCPAQIRAGQAGIGWNDFKAMVQDAYDGKTVAKPKPQPKPQPQPKPVTGASYTGNSVVEYLNSINQDSSFNARARLAADKGIKNYRGTASQNLLLLNMLRSEGNAQAKPTAQKNPSPKKSPREVAEEIFRGQGDWGNNPGRREKLIERGYSPSEVQGIVNQLVEGSRQPAKPKPSRIEAGNRVRVNQNARTYATGGNIPQWVKANTYTVQQTRTQNGVRQVLLREITSWVRESDVTRV